MEYATLTQAELKRSYKAVYLYGYDNKVGYGNRVYFWVCGNGTRSILFSTAGELHIFRNDQFTVEGVLGAAKTMVVEGRVKYLPTEDGDWVDLGPITPEGVRPDDPDMDDIREAFLLEPPAAPTTKKGSKKQSGWLDDVGGW